MTFFDWLGRVIMLVLAGMITLSIIGAIAAIPSGGLPERIGMVEREATCRRMPSPRLHLHRAPPERRRAKAPTPATIGRA